MAKDPVCGTNVHENTATAATTYKGTTYYFCCKSCKATFDKEPDRFLAAKPKH